MIGAIASAAITKPSATPVQATRFAPAGSPAPSDWPTRIVIAADRPIGSMNTIAAKFSAIWCAATCTSPKRPTSTAMLENAATSAKPVAPIGAPRRSRRSCAARVGNAQSRHR